MNRTTSHTGTGNHDPGLWMGLRKAGLILAALLCAAWGYQDLPMRECAWCRRSGAFVGLNRHHIIPQSVCPEWRDEPDNLIVLCRACHACLGHRQNWRTWNPDVDVIVKTYTNSLPCRRGE
jgi:hypothetical protein